MRLAFALAVLPLPSLAWEFSPDPICTLTHLTDGGEIIVTYDARLPEYALTIRLNGAVWPDVDSFGMEFLGSNPVRIGTTRHTLSDDRTVLTVRDAGFGNVLDGLEFNAVVGANSGDQSISASLTDAAPAVRAFRACPNTLPATS